MVSDYSANLPDTAFQDCHREGETNPQAYLNLTSQPERCCARPPGETATD